MLVLSRKDHQKVIVGSNITIHILETHHGRVKLGIEAPQDVDIRRDDTKNVKHTPETTNV